MPNGVRLHGGDNIFGRRAGGQAVIRNIDVRAVPVADQWMRWWNDEDEIQVDAAGRIRLEPFGGKIKKALPPNAKRGEDLFQLILSGIREIYDVEGTIAGGAARDLAVGDVENINDVDVFLPMTYERFADHYDELGWSGELIKAEAKEYKGKDTGTFASTRAKTFVQYHTVDLVFLGDDKPLTPKRVANFPIYAQRCVWTLGEGLVKAPEAKRDIEGKTFTIDPVITDRERVLKLTEKVEGWKKREAYKDWTLTAPELKEWWEAK